MLIWKVLLVSLNFGTNWGIRLASSTLAPLIVMRIYMRSRKKFIRKDKLYADIVSWFRNITFIIISWRLCSLIIDFAVQAGNLRRYVWQIRQSVHQPNRRKDFKNLSRHIHIQEEFSRADLPVTIVRPNVIGASLEEPCPCWIQNISAFAGIFIDLTRRTCSILLTFPKSEVNRCVYERINERLSTRSSIW